MVDIRKSIEAKSDRLNADDLIGSPLTITIENVQSGPSENPVAVYYKGCNGKPWYPCKTVRRAMVAAWSDDGKSWIGKSCTLYRDPEVIYGGVKVGGIRISHFSHIATDMVLMLAEKRGKKTAFTFKVLKIEKEEVEESSELQKARGIIDRAAKAIEKAATLPELEKITSYQAYISSMKTMRESTNNDDKEKAEAITRLASEKFEEISRENDAG